MIGCFRGVLIKTVNENLILPLILTCSLKFKSHFKKNLDIKGIPLYLLNLVLRFDSSVIQNSMENLSFPLEMEEAFSDKKTTLIKTECDL